MKTQTIDVKRLENIARKQFGDDASESLIKDVVQHCIHSIQREYKHKTVFWIVEENSSYPRFHFLMDDPNAVRQFRFMCRTKAGAFAELERELNPTWKPPRVTIEWVEQGLNEYRMEWDESCEGDLVMKCSAIVRTTVCDE